MGGAGNLAPGPCSQLFCDLVCEVRTESPGLDLLQDCFSGNDGPTRRGLIGGEVTCPQLLLLCAPRTLSGLWVPTVLTAPLRAVWSTWPTGGPQAPEHVRPATSTALEPQPLSHFPSRPIPGSRGKT